MRVIVYGWECTGGNVRREVYRWKCTCESVRTSVYTVRVDVLAVGNRKGPQLSWALVIGDESRTPLRGTVNRPPNLEESWHSGAGWAPYRPSCTSVKATVY